MWSRVSWTEASQILSLLDGEDADTPRPAVQDPKRYFDSLVVGGALERAVAYLGVALPCLDAVRWAWAVLQAGGRPIENEWHARLRNSVAHWIKQPSDELRWTIWTTATEREEGWPEKLLAGAIFFSGGSIAPDEVSNIPPPPTVCGKLAGSAVVAAANATIAPDVMLRTAILIGDQIANRGPG